MQEHEKKIEHIMPLYDEDDMSTFDEKFKKQNGADFQASKRFKKRINRIFREELGSKNIPHPEVDNAFERTRSRLIRWLAKKR